MSNIRAGVGLISGLDTESLVTALINLQKAPITRLSNRMTGLKSTQTGITTLEASVLAITTSIQQLGTNSNFNSFNTNLTDKSQFNVTTGTAATPGVYSFQSVQKASTHALRSKGYADASAQAIGAGSITISNGGGLERPTFLDSLNSGNGVRRGSIRVTDRSGASADIDLSKAYTISDVISAINSNETIDVTARADGANLVLTDTSGSTSKNLTIVDLNGGHTAADLGIKQSVASNTLTGDDVYFVTGDFALNSINDGNSIRLLNGAPAIKITLTDDSSIEVNLDGAVSLNDVVSKINGHEDNDGKVTAAVTNGRLVLTDTSGGGGSSAFAVEDINSASVVKQLGIDVDASGGTITGKKLAAGMNSVLLRNLNGGKGIGQLGQISVTDRGGRTATIDLSSAESLDEVMNAINDAVDDDDDAKLQLTARINSTGTGIEIVDTSGSTSSNLIIADVGMGTLASDLGIATDAATTSVNSGRLNHRYVNEATSVTNYAPDGLAIQAGSIKITDSAGNTATIEMSSAVKTVGDVLQRINAASGISVSAELNDTGDGFVLIDEAGGAGTLKVEESGGSTAADLRLLGEAVLGGDGKYRISSRNAVVVDIDSDDTLNDLVEKIGASAAFVKASILDDGSAFNSKRLSLVAGQSGASGKLFIETSGIDLGLTVTSEARDALLRVGDSVETGFVVASKTNSFDNVAPGIDVDILATGTSIVDVTITRDQAKIEKSIQSFVDSYNGFVTQTKSLTKFDPETQERGILQGNAIVLRVEGRMQSLINRQFLTSESSLRSLAQVGVRVTTDGKLEFDKAQFNTGIKDDPDAVSKFFLEEENGFAKQFGDTLESFTDSFKGTFTLEKNSLQASLDSLDSRITDLNEILVVRRDRLLQQFMNMESILGQLQSQQQSLSAISTLRVQSVGKGIY